MRDWKANKDKLIDETNERFKYRIGHSGVKSSTYQIEESLLNWINHNKLLGIYITIKSVIVYTIIFCPFLKEKNYHNYISGFKDLKKEIIFLLEELPMKVKNKKKM